MELLDNAKKVLIRTNKYINSYRKTGKKEDLRQANIQIAKLDDILNKLEDLVEKQTGRGKELTLETIQSIKMAKNTFNLQASL